MVRRLSPDAIGIVALCLGVYALTYLYPIDRSSVGDFVGHLGVYLAFGAACEALRRVVRRAIGRPSKAR